MLMVDYLSLGFQFIWIPTESGHQALHNCLMLSSLFPIYMDPDRVGTGSPNGFAAVMRCFQFIWIPTESGQPKLAGTKHLTIRAFPIYMDPDRVGTW